MKFSKRQCISLSYITFIATCLGMFKISLFPNSVNACTVLDPNNPSCTPILYELDKQRQEWNQTPSRTEPEIILSPLNAALVWWNAEDGTPGYSLAVNRLYSTQAEADAMAHCYVVGGRNCRVAFVTAGGWIAVAKGNDGSLYAAEAPQKDEASQQAMNRCNAASQECTIIAITKNN